MLRYTPGGIAAVDFRIRHASTQVEAGIERRIDWEMDAVVLGDLAPQLASMPLGASMRCQGFLAPRRQGGRQWVLHLQKLTASSD